MVATAYQYQSDDGNTYQVVLPSDFAAAMSYQPALGFESYLPSYISMRYSTYQSNSGLIINSIYVTSPFNAVNPPIFITVGGVVYTLKSSYGEQRGFTSNPTILTIAGPQGPPGPSPIAQVTTVTGGAGINVTPTTGNVVVSNTGVTSFAPSMTATNLSLTAAGSLNVTNTLSRLPFFLRLTAHCTTGDSNTGWGLGTLLEIPMSAATYYNASVLEYAGVTCSITASLFVLKVGSTGILVLASSSGLARFLTLTDWLFELDAW